MPRIPGGMSRRPSGPPGRLDDTPGVSALEVSLDSRRGSDPGHGARGARSGTDGPNLSDP
jgi:hypothetical protein